MLCFLALSETCNHPGQLTGYSIDPADGMARVPPGPRVAASLWPGDN